MTNKKGTKHHWGNYPMPCTSKGCKHGSRDHSRGYKQKDGTWNGRCMVNGCNCPKYRKPRTF